MKTKFHLLLPIATLLGSALSFADDERKLEPSARWNREADASRAPDRNAPRMRPAAFLGVATSPVPPVLSAQLGLAEGFGLVVDEVMPESPAGKAGVQRFDVLRLFNDQQLVDPGQLASLVRAQSREAEITVTLLRKGQEQKVSVKIAERPMSARRPIPAAAGEIKEKLERLKEGAGDKARKLEDRLRDYEKRLREYQERLKNWRGNPDAEMPKPPEFHPSVETGESLREGRPDGAAKERRLESRREATEGAANAKVRMKDESGELAVSSTDGRNQLTAKDAKGEIIFQGPIDTPEQLRALPEDIRKKLGMIEGRTNGRPIVPLFPKAGRDAK